MSALDRMRGLKIVLVQEISRKADECLLGGLEIALTWISWILIADNIGKLAALSGAACIHCITQEFWLIDGSRAQLEKPPSVISNLAIPLRCSLCSCSDGPIDGFWIQLYKAGEART